MDAETRHQLKQNELAEAIGDLKQKVTHMDRNTVYLLIGIAAVIVLWIAYGVYSRGQAQARSDAWYALLSTPLDYTNAATIQAEFDALRQMMTASDHGLASAARLRLGVALWKYAEAPKVEHAEGAASALVSEAIETLRPLAQDNSASTALVSAATYALAGAYESAGRWDEARAAYEALQSERFAGTPFGPGEQSLATQLLGNLDELKEPIMFVAPEPKPAETAPTVEEGAEAAVETPAAEAAEGDAPSEAEPAADETPEDPASETPLETDAE